MPVANIQSRKGHMKMSTRIDLTGQRFGRLTVVAPVKKPNNSKLYWDCVCDCGGSKVVLGSNLKTGATRSCGCLKNGKYVPIDKIVAALKFHLLEDEDLFEHHPELAELFIGA